MKNNIKLELNKALHNKLFYIAIIIGCAITLISTIEFINANGQELQNLAQIEIQTGLKYNTINDVATPFGRWIGLEGFSLGSSILYFVFPLLIAIPFGWSYCAECKSGYEKNVVLRSGKTNYYLSKYIALFISGGLTMVISLLFSFLSLAMFLPLVPPNISSLIYYGITPHHLFSEFFYTNPYVYILFMCVLNFIFSGLIASLCYTASVFTKNRIVVTIVPFLVLVLFKYADKFLYTFVPSLKYETNPMAFLHGVYSETTVFVLLIEAVILTFITLGLILIRGKRNEIY